MCSIEIVKESNEAIEWRSLFVGARSWWNSAPITSIGFAVKPVGKKGRDRGGWILSLSPLPFGPFSRMIKYVYVYTNIYIYILNIEHLT